MAKVNLTTIKKWFETDDKPNQDQFWDAWDSFWHKDQNIPNSKIEGLADLFQGKASAEALSNHTTHVNAHADLFDAKADKNALAAVATSNDYNDLANKPVFKTIENEYADMAALYADQANQNGSSIQFVADASAHPDIANGSAYFEYLAYTVGDHTDYRLMSDVESAPLSNSISDAPKDTKDYVRNNGAWKEVTISPFPAPYLEELIPDSHLPSTTGNFILRGSFFTENMTVVVEGQALNYINFISDNEVHVNLTTGATEGTFNVTLNNGIEAVFEGALLIVLGAVFEPTQANWNNVTLLDVSESGASKVQTYGSSSGTATWNQIIDKTKDWELRLSAKASPLGFYIGGNDYHTPVFELIKTTDSASIIKGQKYYPSTISTPTPSVRTEIFTPTDNWKTATSGPYNTWSSQPIVLRHVNGTLYFYVDGAVVYTFNYNIIDDLYLRVNNKYYDWIGIKYIELAT